jgi:hypothetical protein
MESLEANSLATDTALIHLIRAALCDRLQLPWIVACSGKIRSRRFSQVRPFPATVDVL